METWDLRLPSVDLFIYKFMFINTQSYALKFDYVIICQYVAPFREVLTLKWNVPLISQITPLVTYDNREEE